VSPRSPGVPLEKAKSPARLRDGLPVCLIVFIGARLLLSALGVIGVGHVTQNVPPSDAVPAGWEAATPGFHNAWDGTDRWDAGWYIRIARDGYGSYGSAAFFPAYPLAIRAVWSVVGGDGLAPALLVSNAAFFLSLLLFHQLTSDEYDLATARRAVVLLAAFPTSFFFLAPYSESLFLLFSILAFREARRDRWWSSAMAGASAAFTRSTGIALLPALVVEAINRSREDGRSAVPRVAAALCVAVGPALYFAFWAARGHATAPLTAQGAFGRALTFPLVTLGRTVALATRGFSTPIALYRMVDLLVTLPVIVAIGVGWRRWRPSYATYVGIGLVFLLSDSISIRPLASVPRYIIVFFPVYWTFARWLQERKMFAVVVGCCLIVWCALALAFMNWVPVF